MSTSMIVLLAALVSACTLLLLFGLRSLFSFLVWYRGQRKFAADMGLPPPRIRIALFPPQHEVDDFQSPGIERKCDCTDPWCIGIDLHAPTDLGARKFRRYVELQTTIIGLASVGLRKDDLWALHCEWVTLRNDHHAAHPQCAARDSEHDAMIMRAVRGEAHLPLFAVLRPGGGVLIPHDHAREREVPEAAEDDDAS